MTRRIGSDRRRSTRILPSNLTFPLFVSLSPRERENSTFSLSLRERVGVRVFVEREPVKACRLRNPHPALSRRERVEEGALSRRERVEEGALSRRALRQTLRRVLVSDWVRIYAAAARFLRMRRRISLAACGMLVPGP